MKKIFKLIIIMLVFITIDVNAASFTIKASSNKLSPGGKATLKITGQGVVGRFNISVSQSSVISLDDSSVWIENSTQTISISALNYGTSVITVTPVSGLSDTEGNKVSLASKSITITVEKPREKSNDNNLKSLVVSNYNLNEEFEKNKLEYSVNVPEGTTSIFINAQSNDGYATISGIGEREVNPGINTFEIVVTPEIGDSKVYKLTVNVIDENPIEVKINDKKYTLIKYSAGVTCPSGYETTTKMIENIEIPACYNQIIKYTLVGLKDSEGHIVLARYKNNNYELYSELSSNTLIIIPQKSTKDFKNYEKMNIKINDQDVEVYKLNKDSEFSIIYGLNIATGKKDYYVYDEENKTFVLYDDEYINELEDLNEYYLIACIFFGSGLFLLTIGIIFSNNKKKKKKVTKNKKEEIEENVVETNIINSNSKNEKKSKKDKNEIVEVEENPDNIIEETEVYDIFEDNKKKQKGKKKK